MRNRLIVSGQSCGWIPGHMAGPEGRHVTLGPNNETTKVCRKTKVGAARMLEADDARRAEGKFFLSDDQRQIYLDRAGKTYKAAKAEKVADPYARLADEGTEEYVERVKALVA